MTPYLQDADCTLWHGDALQVLAGMEDGSVDCVVTSPPYWGLRDYGTGTWEGGDAGCDHEVVGGRAIPAITHWNKGGVYDPEQRQEVQPAQTLGGSCGLCGARRIDQQLGLEPTPDMYVAALVTIFREIRRVLAPHGTCWVNLGSSFANKQEQMIPQRVALALQAPYYTGRIKDERDRIWLAATIEAEGCLFIHKRKAGQPNGQGYHRKNDSYGAGLEVASTDRVIVERCMEIAGIGSICEQSPDQNARRKQTIYRWNVRSNECRWIISELYPHLIAKQHEARLLIGCPSSGDDARKAWESLKAIHQGQKPGIDFGEPEGMWERGWFLRSEIIWAKCMPNPMPESVTDRPTKSHEYVFLLTKQPRYWFDAEAVREPHQEPWRGHGEKENGDTPRDPLVNWNARSKGVREYNPAGRNVRSVWTIATQPYPEAHFATYPEELVRRCVLAGCPERVCRECGKASERMVEKQLGREPRITPSFANHHGAGRDGRDGSRAWIESVETLGWSDCGHNQYRPGVVLDPFAGSGTTLYVARNHGRHSVGIDLSEEYLELAARRLQQQSLFSEASA